MSEIPETTPQSDGAEPDQGPASEPERAAVASPPSSPWRDRLPVLTIPLSRVQMVVGLTAGMLSISGFLYPALRASRAPLPLGEVVTVVQEARSRRPVMDATVEILTPGKVLVTTLSPAAGGRARHVIKEGTYRVRVSHPRFGVETRSIEVLAGTIAEVRFQLSPRHVPDQPAASPGSASRPRPSAAVVAPPPAVVTSPSRPAAPEREPAERRRDASGVRRTPLRDDQSP